MKNAQRYFAIIPAAGIGCRMANETPKQYLMLNGLPIISHTLNIFLKYSAIEKIIVAIAENDRHWQTLNITNDKVSVVTGGKERCHSVLNALNSLQNIAADNDWILVHDAVRPCLQSTDLDQLITQLRDHPVGGLLGVPVRDTIKKTNSQHEVVATVDRSPLWCAYSPQMFRYKILHDALTYALANNLIVTDEASAIEHLGKTPQMIQGKHSNIKITVPEDLLYAEWFLRNIE